jgi:Uma2 family endonuclease
MTTKSPIKKFSPAQHPSGDGLCLSGRWLWTVEEFERVADMGAFGSDEKLELIEGEIIRKMTQREPHAWAIQAVTEVLRNVFAQGYSVRIQLPLVFAPNSKPEPDIAVVSGSFSDYKKAHPKTASLVVEISDSTLMMDQNAKASLYARAGIPEYWIVNLPERLIEIYRQPGPMPSEPLGHGYRSLTRSLEGDFIAPLDFPKATIPVSDLLP